MILACRPYQVTERRICPRFARVVRSVPLAAQRVGHQRRQAEVLRLVEVIEDGVAHARLPEALDVRGHFAARKLAVGIGSKNAPIWLAILTRCWISMVGRVQ